MVMRGFALGMNQVLITWKGTETACGIAARTLHVAYSSP